MKIPILLTAVLGYTLAVPNGYYHTEYNYKTSQSSFRNNELEHKTDDQGYYKKDGDLENRYKPIEDSNSEHSEYVNPKFQNTAQSQYGYDLNRDTNSYGHMRADGTYGSGNNLEVEDLAHSSRIYGSQNGYGSSSGSNYGSYGISSNLRTVTSRVQQEFEREIQDMIRYNNMQAQSRLDLSQLERELRQNLTERLNNELNMKYGQQIIRSGMSYSMVGGRLQPTANYNNQEFVDLKNQIENALVSQLRSQYNQYSYTNTNTNTNTNNYAYRYTTTERPYYPSVTYRPIYPSLPTQRYVDYSQNEYNGVKTKYTPVSSPESITSIASKVQSQLDANLNNVLDETRRTHFSSSQQYSLTNPDVLLERLRNELRNNITYQLDDIIRQNYGSQTRKDGYLYSIGPSGALSTDYNYSSRDLDSLKEQIERNLVNKLNRDFESFSKSWSSSSSISKQSSYGTNYGTGANYGTGTNYGTGSNPNYYQTNDYATGAYGSQSSGNMAELQRQLQSDLSRQLNLALNKESQGSYTYSPQTYQTSLQELSDQLNRNLTRHLQEYSASGSYAAHGNFDRAQMADLRSKLEQNLMNQLREGLQQSMQTHSSFSSSSSRSSSGNYQTGYGSGICCQDDDPTIYRRTKRSYRHSQQLGQQEEDLGQQLVLQDIGWKPWERYGSHSPSSKHISPPTQHTPHYTIHQDPQDIGWKPKNLHFGTTPQYNGWKPNNHHFGTPSHSSGKSQVGQEQEELGQQQEIEDFDYTPQVQANRYTHHSNIYSSNVGQQQEDLGQQQQEVEDFDYTSPVASYHKVTRSKLQLNNVGQEQEDLGQQQQEEEDLDYTPQPTGYHKVYRSKLQLNNVGQQQEDLGQQQEVDDLDYTPQATGYHKGTRSKLQLNNVGQEQEDLGQQQQEVEDLDYTPQATGYHKFTRSKLQQLNNVGQEQEDLGQQQQEVEDLDYTPQATGYQKVTRSKLQLNNVGQQQEDLGQQQEVDDLDYIPQAARYHKVTRSKLQLNNVGQEQEDLGQQQQEVEDLDYTPQATGYHKVTRSKLQLNNVGQQQEDLGQQQEVDDLDYTPQATGYHKVTRSKLQLNNVGQEQEDLGQQQQEVEDLDYTPQATGYHKVTRSKLHLNNVGQQQEVEDLGFTPPAAGYHKGTRNKLQLNNVGQQQEDLGQQQQEVDDLDYATQIQVNRYHKLNHGKLQLNNVGQQQEDLGQQQQELGDLNYAPQVQVNRYHKLNRGKLQVNSVGQEQEELGQQHVVEDLDYTPQVQVNRYHQVNRGKLHLNNVGQQQEDLGQQQQEVEDLDYAPQAQVNRYHKLNRGKLQVNSVGQQQEDLGQQQEVDLQQLEIPSFSKINGGKLFNVDQQQQENVGDEDVDQKQNSWDQKPNINLGIESKPINIGQAQEQEEDDLVQHLNQESETFQPKDSRIPVEQVPDNGEDLTQEVEQIDVNAIKGINALPDDISKKTESIQENLSKKLEVAIIGFCGTDKLNVVNMREKLTQEIRKNVTQEFSRETTRNYLEHELGLSSAQILKLQTLILRKLFAQLEAGIETAMKRDDVDNEPEITDFTTTKEILQTELPEETTLQNGTRENTILTKTTRNHTVITTHTQTSNTKFGVTDQGQFITYPQTREDAENEANSLIAILTNFQKKKVEENNASPLDTGVRTYVSNGTDDNGGKYYTRTTIYTGGNKNTGRGYTRTVSTSSHFSSSSKPSFGGYQQSIFGDQEQQEILGGSQLHKFPETDFGHVDFNSAVSPNTHHSTYGEGVLGMIPPSHSTYNKKIEETSYTNHQLPNHHYGTYDQQKPTTIEHFGQIEESYLPGNPLGQQVEVEEQELVGKQNNLDLAEKQVEEQLFSKISYGKLHQHFGQEQVEQQQVQSSGFPKSSAENLGIDIGQQQQVDFGQEQIQETGFPKKIHQNYGQEQVEDSDLEQQQVETSGFPKLKLEKLGKDLSQQQEVDFGQEQIEETGFHKISHGNPNLDDQQLQLNVGQQPVTDPETVYNKVSQGKLESNQELPEQKVDVESVPEIETSDSQTPDSENLTFFQKVARKIQHGAAAVKHQAKVVTEKAKELKEKIIG